MDSKSTVGIIALFRSPKITSLMFLFRGLGYEFLLLDLTQFGINNALSSLTGTGGLPWPELSQLQAGEAL